MDFLLNPNVSYLLLVIGALTAALALFAPGTGLLEIGALITVLLAGYGIVQSPGINWWALIVIMMGVIPFAMGVIWQRANKDRVWLLVGSMLIFLFGSAYLYQSNGLLPAVSPLLILALWPAALGLTWFIATKTLQASALQPNFNLDRLVGMTGQASTDIRGRGSVYVNGEEWSASSKLYIPAGSTVRVLHRDGLTLEVDLVKP